MKLRDRFNDAKETIKIVEELEISKKQRLFNNFPNTWRT